MDFDDRQAATEAYFRCCPLPAAIADPSGRLVAANPKLTTLLGHPDGALDGVHLSELLHPEDRAATLPQFRGAQSSSHAVWVNRYRAASGEWVALRWYSTHDPETGLVFGVAKDVRETDELSLCLTQMAHRDELTGLANRYLLLDTLERWLIQARAVGEALAVMVRDVDGLKAVNDGAGTKPVTRRSRRSAGRWSAASGSATWRGGWAATNSWWLPCSQSTMPLGHRSSPRAWPTQ